MDQQKAAGRQPPVIPGGPAELPHGRQSGGKCGPCEGGAPLFASRCFMCPGYRLPVAYCRGRAVVIGAVLKDLGPVDAGEEHDSQQEQELDGDSVR